MQRRAIMRLRPGLERLEAKQLLSASASPTHAVKHEASKTAAAIHRVDSASALGEESNSGRNDASTAGSADAGTSPVVPVKFLGFRITNPTIHKVNLLPPFGQVLVQSLQPVPGQVYNIMYVAVKNGTSQIFTASNGFMVRFPNKKRAKVFPILTGNQEWLPKHWIVFYVLTKQYYPLTQIQGGFQFDLGGRSTTLVPGPSAIYQRIKYNPANFANKLDGIVAYGQGAQFGKGPPTGMVDTAINQIVAGRTLKIDFGGHF